MKTSYGRDPAHRPHRSSPTNSNRVELENSLWRTANFGLVDCAATLDFVSQDFVRHFSIPLRKSKVKTQFPLANGQRVTSSTVCEITFIELASHDFQRTFHVLRDLNVANLVLSFTWLNDEQASLQFGITLVST
jgi:hypothetical protein